MNTIIDYEIRSATGDLLYTTPHEDLARKRVIRFARKYPGLYLEHVERIEVRRRLWTDRANYAATLVPAGVAA